MVERLSKGGRELQEVLQRDVGASLRVPVGSSMRLGKKGARGCMTILIADFVRAARIQAKRVLSYRMRPVRPCDPLVTSLVT